MKIGSLLWSLVVITCVLISIGFGAGPWASKLDGTANVLQREVADLTRDNKALTKDLADLRDKYQDLKPDRNTGHLLAKLETRLDLPVQTNSTPDQRYDLILQKLDTLSTNVAGLHQQVLTANSR